MPRGCARLREMALKCNSRSSKLSPSPPVLPPSLTSYTRVPKDPPRPVLPSAWFVTGPSGAATMTVWNGKSTPRIWSARASKTVRFVTFDNCKLLRTTPFRRFYSAPGRTTTTFWRNKPFVAAVKSVTAAALSDSKLSNKRAAGNGKLFANTYL